MHSPNNKFLLLAALFVAFALAPATYAQKTEDGKNVNVINTPKVLNANDSNIFQEFRVDNNFNDAQKVFTYTVPAGKRLVIEYVSVTATIGAGEKVRAFVRGGNGFTEAIHPIVMNYQVTVSSNDVFVGSQPLKLYAEPGTSVVVLVSRRDAANTGAVSPNAGLESSITGYLVDVPQ